MWLVVSPNQRTVRKFMCLHSNMNSKKIFSKVTEPIDQWLELQGLYRKHTAHDSSCLYRAVAEQIYFSQCCHEIVRKQCFNFIACNKEQFEQMIDTPFETYLNKLNNSKEWGSQLELNALSLLYEREILIFEQGETPSCISINDMFAKSIMLCASADNHYDSVYPKSYIMKAAFCQSLAYEILYKGVFGLLDVDYAVDKMLHKSSHSKREQNIQQGYLCTTRSLGLPVKTIRHFELDRYEDELNVRELLSRGITPFPYKVAKALDPDIYRNIEFDVWSDLRREMKLGMLGGNDDELKIGVKCLVKMQPDRFFHAHIQEMEPNNGPVIVFVEELGKKCTVSHDVLEPLPKNHKVQWALPYKQQRQTATLSPKSSFLTLTELGTKWRKNKYNKSRKLKDMFMASSHSSTVHCSPNSVIPSFQQEPSAHSLHYPMEQYNYNSNASLTSTDDCSNSSSQIMPPENITNHNMMPQHADSPSNSPTSIEESEQNITSCNPPIQIIGIPMHHIVCSDTSGGRVSSPSSPVNPYPSYVLCNTQGRVHQSSNMDNFTLQPVNFYAQKSLNLNGSDLPFSDIPTLRFYYNLGHDYFHSGCVMWPTVNTCSLSHTSPPPENTSQLLPDSTVSSEEETGVGTKIQHVQTPTPVHQQTMIQSVSPAIGHPTPMPVPPVPQGTAVPHLTSPGVVSTVVPQVTPMSPTSPQPVSHLHSTHKIIQHHSPSPQHSVCPLVPQSPPAQPIFNMNNMWPGQQTSVMSSPQRTNSPEYELRSTTNPNSEDCTNRGNEAKPISTCQSSVTVHPSVMETYPQSSICPYYVVDSVPYYNSCSYVMQTPTEVDVMTQSPMHSIPSPPVQQMQSVVYHPQALTHNGSMPHWISSEGVPQYTVAM